MKIKLASALMVLMVAVAAPLASMVQAQEAVVEAPDKEALFARTDPQLHANKQVAYHIMRDLLQANHWDLTDQHLTERYLQHNPLMPFGRDTVVRFLPKRFTSSRPRFQTHLAARSCSLPLKAIW